MVRLDIKVLSRRDADRLADHVSPIDAQELAVRVGVFLRLFSESSFNIISFWRCLCSCKTMFFFFKIKAMYKRCPQTMIIKTHGKTHLNKIYSSKHYSKDVKDKNKRNTSCTPF